MIYLIRHGERADDSTSEEKAKIKLSYDPHLSSLGVIQAQKTGKYLKQALMQQQAIIITSPYLRCLQTAFEIAKELSYNNDIILSKGIGECFREDWFERNVLEELEIYQNKKQNYKVRDINIDQVMPSYPETIQEFFGRFSENFNRILDNFKGQNLIIITHGYGVHAVNMLQRQIVTRYCEYCSITQFEQQQNKQMKYYLSNSIEHLNQPKL